MDADIARTAAAFSGVSIPTCRNAAAACGGIISGGGFPDDASAGSGDPFFALSFGFSGWGRWDSSVMAGLRQVGMAHENIVNVAPIQIQCLSIGCDCREIGRDECVAKLARDRVVPDTDAAH